MFESNRPPSLPTMNDPTEVRVRYWPIEKFPALIAVTMWVVAVIAVRNHEAHGWVVAYLIIGGAILFSYSLRIRGSWQ